MFKHKKQDQVSNSFILGIDADDTLWENEALFYEIQDRFFELMSHWSEPSETNGALLENEKTSIPVYGYGVTSFVRSMVLTAIEISKGEIETKDITKIFSWGDDLINAPIDLLPGVEEALKDLHDSYSLLLITKGDVLHQRAKVEKSGLSDFFWNIEVVGEKDTDIYKMLLDRYGINPEKFVMIGNSIISDVLPVLSIGAKAIHVPHHTTWELEIPDSKELENVDFPVVENLGGVKEILLGWNK
ncbi:MAG: HAD family hydrolase [Actinomycetota bacterium]|nr:HAD family hydrolase [Actinomycetota bacterium]MED5277111.1 HAD family hydrolase [Actinomycetota bacterium]|tara:strand:- start:10935 stop:11666 length:732 start_codon:yes stop_codon:yes gene_type:complete